MKRQIITILALTSFHLSEASALEFNILNDCKKIRSLIQLADQQDAQTIHCRSPVGPIEARIAERFPYPSCFLSNPELSGLAGFECFITRGFAELKALDCYRSVPESEIEEYKTNYRDKYSAEISKYLLSTKQCDVTTGDAIQAPDIILRGPAQTAAAYEFGFAVTLGSRDAISGAVMHAFARLDPKIASHHRAIEIATVWVGEPAKAAVQNIDWDSADKLRIVNIDEGEEVKQGMKQFVANARIPVHVDFLGFDLTAGYLQAKEVLDHSKRDKGLAILQESVVSQLKDHDFEELSDQVFTKLFGSSPEDVVAFYSQNVIPFDLQDNIRMSKAAGFVRESATCSPQDGAIFALLMGTVTNKMPAYYGDVAVLIFALGNCLADDRPLVESLVEDLRMYVKEETEE